jgi:hypothetical protein
VDKLYLSLREERSLAGLVLGDLMLGVLAALFALAILQSCQKCCVAEIISRLSCILIHNDSQSPDLDEESD